VWTIVCAHSEMLGHRLGSWHSTDPRFHLPQSPLGYYRTFRVDSDWPCGYQLVVVQCEQWAIVHQSHCCYCCCVQRPTRHHFQPNRWGQPVNTAVVVFVMMAVSVEPLSEVVMSGPEVPRFLSSRCSRDCCFHSGCSGPRAAMNIPPLPAQWLSSYLMSALLPRVVVDKSLHPTWN
jgi:hypothetical protein